MKTLLLPAFLMILPLAACTPSRHLAPGVGASHSAVFEAHKGAAKAKKGKPSPLGAAESAGIHQAYLDGFGGTAQGPAIKDDTAAWNALAKQAGGSAKGSSIKLGK